MEAKKKLPRIIVVTIVLASISLFLLAIVITTSILNVKRAEKAISDIGEVTYTLEVEQRIDYASNYYNKLDTNIGLNNNVSNKDDLELSKYNYVRLGIKKALVSYNRRFADNVSEEDIKLYVNDAYDKLKKYFDESRYEEIEGYSEFKPLLDIYKDEEEKQTNSGSDNKEPAEEVEIC